MQYNQQPVIMSGNLQTPQRQGGASPDQSDLKRHDDAIAQKEQLIRALEMELAQLKTERQAFYETITQASPSKASVMTEQVELAVQPRYDDVVSSEEIKVAEPSVAKEQELADLLEETRTVMNSITAGDLTELKALKNPPADVIKVVAYYIFYVTGERCTKWGEC